MSTERRRSLRAAAIVALALIAAAGWAPTSTATFIPLSAVTKVDAGAYYSCAIGPGALAQCWGRASSGGGTSFLGRSTFPGVAGPVERLPPVSDISVGDNHICAVTTFGAAKCFGSGYSGQLGTGNAYEFSTTPVQVSGLQSGVAATSVGYSHSCALIAGGSAKCWGSNSDGQIGDNSQQQANVPVDVSGVPSGATLISAGAYHTCAVVAGAAKCWGANYVGQLGDASTTMRLAPVGVQGLTSGVTRISAGGAFTCAVHAGAAKCWGNNVGGLLGDGSLADSRTAPVQVWGLASGVVDIVAGNYHACAVKGSGELYCWGANYSSQLGDGTLESRNTPVLVSSLSGPAQSVAVGDGWTCARLASATVECFGTNNRGQLGIGSVPQRFSPVDAAIGAGPLTAIDAGETHTCGLGTDGLARCWGFGYTGDGTAVPRPFPVAVAIPQVATISAGRTHSCASTPSGQVYCWGENSYGQLGIGMPTFEPRLLPQQVPGLNGVSQVAAGDYYSCAVDGGAVRCWGGATGNIHPVVSSYVPVQIAGLPATVVSVTTAPRHACVLRENGGIKCWGANFAGELGDGTRLQRTSPVDVVGLSVGSKAVTAGGLHTCAIAPGDAAVCWGNNANGQLGDGSTDMRLVPTQVVGLQSRIAAIAAGTNHSCALTSAGAVKCWGSNSDGQLGRALPLSSSQPVDVSLPGPAIAIAAGTSYSCASLASGGTKCWGRSENGQLGNGDAPLSAVPRTVLTSDFATTLLLSSSVNPAVHGEPIEISMTIAGGALPANGPVVLRRGSETLCQPSIGPSGIVGYANRGTWSCTVALTPGTHTLIATYSGDEMHSPATVSLQQVVTAIPGQACAGFDDVSTNDPLCRNVEWVRNRGITLGCTAFEFCATSPVSRLAMAAFMNRTGHVLSPLVETVSVAFGHSFGSSSFVCATPNVPAADYPRQAFVDAVISASANSPIDVELRTSLLSFNFSSAGPPLVASFDSAGPKTVRISGTFTIPPATSSAYGVSAFRLAGNAPSMGGTCTTRLIVTSRDETFAPYDPKTP